MDPNANLVEQRRLVRAIQWLWDHCPDDGMYTKEQEIELSRLAVRLAELVEALDEWIMSGGFLPTAWEQGR